jgi:hypothetical protein
MIGWTIERHQVSRDCDKAYSVQYIADAPKYADYWPTIQKMIGSLVIKNSKETGIGTMLYNSTKLYPGKVLWWTMLYNSISGDYTLLDDKLEQHICIGIGC